MPPIHQSPPAPSPCRRCRLILVSSDAKSCPSPFQYRVASLILPLCTGASPGPPPTTTPPSFIGTPPHIGEIHLPCRYFIMLRCRRVHHARRVHRISVNLSMEACPRVSHHRLTVSHANVALALPEPSESCALPPPPPRGSGHVMSGRASQASVVVPPGQPRILYCRTRQAESAPRTAHQASFGLCTRV
jgi:hypothetical protein